MRVTWNRKALIALNRVEAFLFEKSPRAASRAILTIGAASRTLADFPHAGRPAEDLDPEHRELLVSFGDSGYVVSYQVNDGFVEILDVRHQREAGY